jgi:hypothetical protein
VDTVEAVFAEPWVCVIGIAIVESCGIEPNGSGARSGWFVVSFSFLKVRAVRGCQIIAAGSGSLRFCPADMWIKFLRTCNKI